MANPNSVVPLDVLREMEKDGEFGELVNFFCVQQPELEQLPDPLQNLEMIGKISQNRSMLTALSLSAHEVLCTRCGATMVKGIEKYGGSVAYMATVVPISLQLSKQNYSALVFRIAAILPGEVIPRRCKRMVCRIKSTSDRSRRSDCI